MSQEQPFKWKSSLGEPISWVRWSLQGRSKSVSHADGVSETGAACMLCEGRVQKRVMASVHLDSRHFTSSPYATGVFQAATPVLELRGSESEYVHV